MFELTIRTERLLLRSYRLSDAKRLQELAGAWDVAKMLTRVPHPYPDGEAERWIATHRQLRETGMGYVFAIDIGGQCAGSISLDSTVLGDMELGYWLGVPYWKQGFMTEAAAAIVEFGFGWMSMPKIVSGHLPENTASGRVLEKLGFVRCGQRQMPSRALGAEVTCNSLVLTRDAWAAKRV